MSVESFLGNYTSAGEGFCERAARKCFEPFAPYMLAVIAFLTPAYLVGALHCHFDKESFCPIGENNTALPVCDFASVVDKVNPPYIFPIMDSCSLSPVSRVKPERLLTTNEWKFINGSACPLNHIKGKDLGTADRCSNESPKQLWAFFGKYKTPQEHCLENPCWNPFLDPTTWFGHNATAIAITLLCTGVLAVVIVKYYNKKTSEEKERVQQNGLAGYQSIVCV